jgi:hypothetical protein
LQFRQKGATFELLRCTQQIHFTMSNLRFMPLCGLLGVLCLCASKPIIQPKWGFFGHRRINQLAVYALPRDLIGFYKPHLEYISVHAVDPDKRRYAVKLEGPRHFIDLDQYGSSPFDDLPRNWARALLRYSQFTWISVAGDTSVLHWVGEKKWYPSKITASNTSAISYDTLPLFQFFVQNCLSNYGDEVWVLPFDSLAARLKWPLLGGQLHVEEHLSQHGILPFHLCKMQESLTAAFKRHDQASILRLSAEMGHYLGDAHVPLHTTRNYNGQLSNQVGIHAFWESRIPELFADERYDFWVGTAQYFHDPEAFFWQTVLNSHHLVDSVLHIEQRLSKFFPAAQQYAWEEKNGQSIRTQSRQYAAAYEQALDGMVEAQMQKAIRALASAWYTAWVDAGKPDWKAWKQRITELQVNDSLVRETKHLPRHKTREHE